MPYHLNQDEIDSCRKSFDEFDADRSGTIDEFELAEILAAMGYELTGKAPFSIIHAMHFCVTTLSNTYCIFALNLCCYCCRGRDFSSHHSAL